MSVLLETSLGDLVIDLETQQCPKSCLNFLKLCKSFQYNYLTFFSVQKDFLAQTGDPTNTGQGGSCIWSQLDASSPDYSTSSYFTPERHRTMKHTKRGTISMACTAVGDEDEDEIIAGSQFFVTLADNVEYLDRKHAPFGYVVEGDEKGGTLDKINAAFVDKERRPLRDIRIQHLVVLDDPFEDPQGLRVPSRTPSPTPEQLAAIGLDASTIVDDPSLDRPAEEVEEAKRKADTTAAALTLEMVGDLPFAEVRPPENILFVCKLNPITRSEDLELIFSRFGKILSCEVIKDKKTGDSLQYAFIEFDEQKSAEQAYFKMQNVLIDDRRIWVDFSQSVSKLSTSWNTSRSGGKPLRVTAGASRDNRGPDRDQHGGRERRRDQDLVFDFDSRTPPDQSSRTEKSVGDRRYKSDRDDWRGASKTGEGRNRGRYEETPSYRPKHYSEDQRNGRRYEAGGRYDDRKDDHRSRQKDYGRQEDRRYRNERERSPNRSSRVR